MGALTGYLTANRQLSLEKQKHQDSLDEPKRQHRLAALQKSVAALEDAIDVLARFGDGLVTLNMVGQAQAKVQQGKPAVDNYTDDSTRQDYAAAEAALTKVPLMHTWPQYIGRDRVIRSLQKAAESVHRAISAI